MLLNGNIEILHRSEWDYFHGLAMLLMFRFELIPRSPNTHARSSSLGFDSVPV
jgi:hypothetical protein